MADERTEKQEIIGQALARTVYDVPQYVLPGLNQDGSLRGTAPLVEFLLSSCSTHARGPTKHNLAEAVGKGIACVELFVGRQ